jgi:hypothetical protein
VSRGGIIQKHCDSSDTNRPGGSSDGLGAAVLPIPPPHLRDRADDKLLER